MTAVQTLAIALVLVAWFCAGAFVGWWLKGFPNRDRNGILYWRWSEDTGLDPTRGNPQSMRTKMRLAGRPGEYTGLLPAWRLIVVVVSSLSAALVYWGMHTLEVLPWWPF